MKGEGRKKVRRVFKLTLGEFRLSVAVVAQRIQRPISSFAFRLTRQHGVLCQMFLVQAEEQTLRSRCNVFES